MILLISLGSITTYWYKKKHSSIAALSNYIYDSSLITADTNKAIGLLEQVIDKGDGYNYKHIAQLRLAALYTQNNKSEQAIALLRNISRDTKTEGFIRETAQFVLCKILIKKGNDNNIEKELDTFVKNSRVFHFSALELQAIYFLDHNKRQAGLNILNNITNSIEAPLSMKSLARELYNAFK